MSDELLEQARAVTHAACKPLVGELAAEIERLQAALQVDGSTMLDWHIQLTERAAEIKRLEADNERLQRMLRAVGNHPDTPELIKQYAQGRLDPADGAALAEKEGTWSIRPLFAWYDLWIGVFWDRKSRKLYILPVPCVGIVIQFGLGGHRWRR